jgi:hypothetical protein
MQLRIGPPYRGRLHQQAVELVRAGTRVGMMWVSGTGPVHCHVCEKDFNPPALDPEHHDAMGKCPHCETPFIFAQA